MEGINQLHLQPLGVCAEFSYSSSPHHYRTEERAKRGIKQATSGDKSGESRVNKTGYETDYDSDYDSDYTAYD